MRTILAILLINMFASFTFVMEMGDLMELVFVVTSMISTVAWLAMAFLTIKSRHTYGPLHPEFFSWVSPLQRAFVLFCGVSAARALLNVLLVWFPIFAGVQALALAAHNMCLVGACGYASVYYRRLPAGLARLSQTLRHCYES